MESCKVLYLYLTLISVFPVNINTNRRSNLKHTYRDDTMFCCSIETYLQTIDAKLEEYKDRYPDLFVRNEETDHEKNE